MRAADGARERREPGAIAGGEPGQGSVPTAAIVAEPPALAAEISAGTFTVDAAPRPLSEVEAAWTDPAPPGRRVVLTP